MLSSSLRIPLLFVMAFAIVVAAMAAQPREASADNPTPQQRQAALEYAGALRTAANVINVGGIAACAFFRIPYVIAACGGGLAYAVYALNREADRLVQWANHRH
jgi:hypothetical protein